MAAVSALVDYRVVEEDRWNVQEKEPLNRLGPKAATFFQIGFDGAVKQFAIQGNPPPGADSEFLDCVVALSKYPPEAFNL